MNTTMDLGSISVDVDSSSNNISSTSNSVQLQTTDYSKYLRKIAGIDTSNIPCTIICIAFDLIVTFILEDGNCLCLIDTEILYNFAC